MSALRAGLVPLALSLLLGGCAMLGEMGFR